MSELADRFNEEALPRFRTHLGDTCTVYLVTAPTVPYTVTMVFNEFVGAIDEKGRGIFLVDADEYPSYPTAPRRGDKVVLNSRSWYVVDVRQDETHTYELRCDNAQADV